MVFPETNLTLIARMKRPADEQAWQEFVSAYEPFLVRMLIRRGLAEMDVRDVVQQVFLAVYRSLEQWTPDGEDGSFRRWLSGVTRNTTLKFLRLQRRQPKSLGGSDFLNQQSELAVKDIEDQQLTRDYDRELFLFAADLVRREFRNHSWTAFWQTAVEGRTVDDLAQELNVQRGAVYMSRCRIMARIRARIAELGELESL